MVSRTQSQGRAALIGALVTMLLALTPAARAASPPITTQAAAANAAFLAYAPPPTGGAKALCLVDTGVSPTPDTTPALAFAMAIDGGSPNDVDPLWHGTIDAAIAAGAGHGVLGAWPQLKIVSLRGTSVPSPGQLPTFDFDDYSRGVTRCATALIPEVQVVAIALPLSSEIPPAPDQAVGFASSVQQARVRGISILAAAGNDPGPVQLPGSLPGVLAVGAGDDGGGLCPFSANSGLAFYAPGCGIDQIDTRGETFCCGNGTSQASVFAAAVLVALRSYKPDLSAEQAVQHLLSTTHNGRLDVAAAFRGAGLGDIVEAGTAAIPQSAQPPSPVAEPALPTRRVPRPRVRRVTWKHGVLKVTLMSLPRGVRLHAKVTFARRKPLFVGSSQVKLRIRSPLPWRVELRYSRGGVSSATVSPKVIRPR